jgi:hypothetical protein
VPLILSSRPLRQSVAPLGSSYSLQHQLLFTFITLICTGCADPNAVLPQYCTDFCLTVKGTRNVHPRTGHEGPEGEERYSYTPSLTSALDGSGLSTPLPCRFTPGKETLYPLYRRLGVPTAGMDGCGKARPPRGFESLY